MKPTEHLEAMRQLLEAGWCQRKLARNKHLIVVDPSSPDATEFCIWGAHWRAHSGAYSPHDSKEEYLARWDSNLLAVRALESAVRDSAKRKGIPYYTVQNFNDRPDITREDVLAVLDQAIAGSRAGDARNEQTASK